MAIEIHNRRTKIKYQPRSVPTIDGGYSVNVFDETGENGSITYDNLIDVLSAIFLVAGDTRLYYGTTVNNLTIGGGSHTFDTQAGLAYTVGQRVRLSYNSANYMEGLITDYTGTSMTITVDYKGGSGSYNSWVLSPTTEQIVPDGGTTGEVLMKSSNTSYDVEWGAASGGGGLTNMEVKNITLLRLC